MSEVHLPHQHSDEGTMRELQESVETIGSFQTVADVFKQLSDSSRVRIFWLLCHCEECVIDLSALVGMSSPAVSHHLRQLRESGLLVSRRVGKEVYYRASDSEQAQLLHRMIERTMEISCPEEESKAATGAPHLPPLDAEVYEGGGTSEQIKTIRAVHDYLTQHLSSRVTIDELQRRFLEQAVELLGTDIEPPAFPQGDGAMKLSAAWLIERAGFRRGQRWGAVGLSTKHALALCNRGGATTAELLDAAHRIAGRVELAFGVELRPEPVLVGEDWDAPSVQ